MANNATLEERITQLATAFANDVAREVRAQFAAQVAAMVSGGALPERRKRGRPAGGTQTRAATAPASSKRHYPPHCLFCNKPHGGPRSSFTCADHASESKGEKRKALAAWKEKAA